MIKEPIPDIVYRDMLEIIPDHLVLERAIAINPAQPKHKIGDLVCYIHSNSYGFGTVTQRRITSKSEEKHHIEYKVKWEDGKWDKWLEEWMLLTPEEKGRPRPSSEKGVSE